MKRSLRNTNAPSDKINSANNRVDPSLTELDQAQKAQLDMLKGVAKSYEGKSEDEIFSDLSKKVQGAKRDGTLDDNKMSSIASTLAPMLTPEQRSKLNNLMKRLKN